MRILVAIIAYNEAESIGKVIDDLNNHNIGYDIIVVNNGSLDNTEIICESRNVKTISHCVNSDINGTWKTYLNYAFRNDYDIVCQFDGDGQHLAAELIKIIEPIRKKVANQVIGSRFLGTESFRSTFTRRIGIRLFSFILSLIFGYTIKDVTSGFIAFDKRVIRFFATYYKSELNDSNQTHLLSHFSGAKIVEVPVKMNLRAHGTSLFNWLNSLVYPFNGLFNIAGCLLLKKEIIKDWTNNYEY
jgi:glycosyltransferase involved in cell wall biosynthesis